MYSAERTFLCPDGEYRLFDFHLKRWGTRIHFFDFPASKRILVGYVGDHLRISGMRGWSEATARPFVYFQE